jgi:hypothetical protein
VDYQYPETWCFAQPATIPTHRVANNSQYDAVLILAHAQDFHFGDHQRFVFVNMESQAYRIYNLKAMRSFFNWTMTFKWNGTSTFPDRMGGFNQNNKETKNQNQYQYPYHLLLLLRPILRRYHQRNRNPTMNKSSSRRLLPTTETTNGFMRWRVVLVKSRGSSPIAPPNRCGKIMSCLQATTAHSSQSVWNMRS